MVYDFFSYLKAFTNRWFVTMSGPASVPLAIAGYFVENNAARIVLSLTAIECFVFAAYWVWRGERKVRIEVEGKANDLERKANNLAYSLHVELADLVARCWHDWQYAWKDYWPQNQPAHRYDSIELRRFTPTKPKVLYDASSNLASLGQDVMLRLVQFRNGLDALRRDILDTAGGLTQHPATSEQMRNIADRFFRTLKPGIEALRALEPNPDPAVEQDAMKVYDADHPERLETLRERIQQVLEQTDRARPR